MDRTAAERDLERILRRALRNVPRVRADKIAHVTNLFDQALSVMAKNLMPENENGNHEEFFPRPLPKNVGLVVASGVTRDFSSPSLTGRRIGASTPTDSQLHRQPVPASERSMETSKNLLNMTSNGVPSSSSSSSSSSNPGYPKHNNQLLAAALQAKAAGNGAQRMVTADYSSPSLKRRTIGGAGSQQAIGSSSSSSAAASGASAEIPEDEVEISGPVGQHEMFNSSANQKLDHLDPAYETRSPQQFRSSLRLLNLASSGLKNQEQPKTPKPSYLRPLSVPNSPSPQDINRQRERLNKTLNKAIEMLPRFDMSAYDQIKEAFSAALLELENNTI